MKSLSLLLLGAAFAWGQTCQTADLVSNGTFDGALSESDCTVHDYIPSNTANFKADAWRLTLRERQVVTLTMTSTEIDPYLYLVSDRGVVLARNDNFGTGKNSELSIQLPAGNYVVVTAGAVTGFGKYQVTTASRAPRSCSAQELSVAGETSEADLLPTDCTGVDIATGSTDASPVDVYKFEVRRAAILDTLMTSTAVDAALSLYASDGRLIRSDNNSGGGTNARLRISLPIGSYTLRAGMSKPGTGAYQISAKLEDRRVCEPVVLTTGQSADGELTQIDCRLPDLLNYSTFMAPIDQYRFELNERSVVKIRQQSTLVDTYLILLDASRRVLIENDDANSTTTDSEVYISLEKGTYTILAGEYYGDTGKYTVTFDVEKLRPCPAVTFDAPGTAAGSIAGTGCRVMDLYSPSSFTAPATKFNMKVTERVWTTVSATGAGLSPLVELISPDGIPIGIDGPVREKAVLLLPGTYGVEVSTRNGETGEITLTAATRPIAVCEATPLSMGETVPGELTTTDCLQAELLPFSSGTARADLWKVNVETPGPIRVDVNTETGVPFVLVMDADLGVIAADLNLGFLTSSQAGWQARPGTYYVMVGSYSGPGRYTIRARPDTVGTVQ